MTQGVSRILTAVVGIPLVLIALWQGNWLFFGFITIVALAGQWEMLRLIRKTGPNVETLLPLLAGGAVMSRFLIDTWPPFLVGALLLLAIGTLRGKVEDAVGRFTGAVASVIYPVLFVSFLIDIRWTASEMLPENESFLLILLLFVLIWATDSGAYYTGKTIGKHKFAPETSPNKTWEGTIGGLAMAILTATLFKLFWISPMGWMDVAILALIGGFWGQYGDLLESSFKRSAGVKDSASLLPGHGGILDRFDSLIFSAPAYWIYLSWFSPLIGG